MSYATWEQIGTRIPETIEIAQSKEVLDEKQAANYRLINDRLATRWSTPVSATVSPVFYAQVGYIEADLTAADVIEYAREAASDDDNVRWHAKEMRQRAEELLKAFATGGAVPPDGVSTGAAAVDDGLTASDVADGEAAAPYFTRSQTGATAW